ncbi:MAG: hypothetical protein HY580_05730 [Nitrospinae bacterium]|nr:hypothetical protein [Nitrospinota bacterium]
MTPATARLETLLRQVGLLRKQFSLGQKSFADFLQHSRNDFCNPPEEFFAHLRNAQDGAALLLRASRLLSAHLEDMKNGAGAARTEDVLAQAREIVAQVRSLMAGLSQVSIPGLSLEPSIWEEGIRVAGEALDG